MELHTTHAFSQGLREKTQRLLMMMSSPLCGMSRQITSILRSRQGARLMSAYGDLTNVQHLSESPSAADPPNYHIGTSGVFEEEVLIRLLSESIERYSQVTSEINKNREYIYASYNEMVGNNRPVISPEKLDFFSAEQLRSSGLPYQSFNTTMTLGWICVDSLVSSKKIFVPAQLLTLGYRVKSVYGEPWLYPAMTTGTASHTTTIPAMRNALLELIQVDTAMGHWYSGTKAVKVEFDNRTRPFESIIKKYLGGHAAQPLFYWLQNPDLPGIYVTCIFKQSSFPKLVIGQGADTSLLPALYKAFLEASAILTSLRLPFFNIKLGIYNPVADPEKFFNLDDNLVFYGKGNMNQLICRKFPDSKGMNASELPEDMKGNAKAQVRCLIEAFGNTNKELIYDDLTGSEAKALGFVVSRIWSPNTLSLALPSLPPKRHGRFSTYGGIVHEYPHPYP